MSWLREVWCGCPMPFQHITLEGKTPQGGDDQAVNATMTRSHKSELNETR